MTSVFLTAILTISALIFFGTIIRAMLFARKHKNHLDGVVGKGTWWLQLLFVKNSYGQENEKQRARLAWQWLAAMACVFIMLPALRYFSN